MATSLAAHAQTGADLIPARRRLSESIAAGLVALGDTLIILATGLLICFLYVDPEPDTLVKYATALTLIAYMIVQSFYVAHLYRFSAIITPYQQIGKVASISTIVVLLVVAAGFALKISEEFSRVWLFSTAIASVGLMVAGRGVALFLIRKLASRGFLARNIFVYGAGKQAERFIEHLSGINAPWNRVIGVFDDRQSAAAGNVAGVPVLGNLEDLVRVARDSRADDIVVALPWGNQTRLTQILHELKVLPANIRLAPDLPALRILSRSINYQYGVPLATVLDKPLSGWNALIKRALDIVVSGMLLVLLAPLMFAIALAVKLDSKGPVLFRQRRYGFNNELIEVRKYRTMYSDQQDQNAERLATPDDPRVTRVGSFLRRTSLDELPQLLNVLLGDMSLVGPRPHALRAKAAGELYQDAVGEYAARHRVKPGITGWAQVNGWRGETDTHEKILKRVEHDLYYIENWSIWLDLRILLRTVGVLLKQQNAY